MSAPFTQARTSLMSATAVFALIAALVSCGWDTPESALHDTATSPEAQTQVASGGTRAAAHRFSDDYTGALRLLDDQAPEQAASTF